MVELMRTIPVDFGSDSPRLLCVVAPIDNLSLSDVQLADVDEYATFVTEKRKQEYLGGRLLLEQALEAWGIDASLLEVRRNEYRAPSIAYMPGTWLRNPLPSISIGHSNGMAFVALVEPSWTVGIDGEPTKLEISPGVFDMMAKGEELAYLQDNPQHSVTMWTGKEAIQKAARRGMHLNPREIKIPIGNTETKISIGNLNFQLKNYLFDGYNISIAIAPGTGYDAIAEDDLLEQTLEAMSVNPEWSVGCNTTRLNL